MPVSRLRSFWPLFTLLASGAMLAAAHAFETFGGLAPCPLCLDQREWHWGVVGVSALALILSRTPIYRPRLALFIIGLVLVGSFLMAGYHFGVEQHWYVAQCDAQLDANADLTFDVNAELEVPRCDTPAWTMFGVSMAGYNALISLGLALLTFAVALWPERKA
ncbi:MAG: disulfide bond formation protein B [Hyphomonadaceae bacterium]